MRVSAVVDIDENDIQDLSFDLVIVFCGYEGRAGYWAKRRGKKVNSNDRVYFDYEDDPVILKKQTNRDLLQKFGYRRVNLPRENELGAITELLRDMIWDPTKKVRILVDYSSMRRTIYTELLSSFLFNLVEATCVDLYFTYSMGRYLNNHAPKYVDSHETLLGLDGRTSQKRQKLVVLNLGYEPVSSLTMLEAIEPDRVMGILASPGVNKLSAKRCMKLNKILVEDHLGGEVDRVPIRSVEKYCRFVLENVGRLTDDFDIVFVPYGPKPHVLGSVLCCFTRREWTNVYIRGVESKPVDVEAIGQTVTTCVKLRRDIEL
ncbi:MAG: hypothetical protein AAGB04_14425 [Pseudomonadota bacterium]